jgi:hypothetical protein
MFKKFTLAAAAGVAAIAVVPAAAEAQPRGYYSHGHHSRGYNNGYYGRSGYNNGYYGNRYYGRTNRQYYGRHRCSGTTGTIIGGAAGALIGRSMDGPRGGRATGTILGGVLGALAGRSIDKSDCRR